MKIIRKESTFENRNTDRCIAHQYPIGDKDMHMAVIDITGRYPDNGHVVDRFVREIWFVMSGGGVVGIENKEHTLEQGDLILIEPREPYFFSGIMTFAVFSTPSWYPEQHERV